jgi:cyclopropane-fatty-acyl-phospholipid synthase
MHAENFRLHYAKTCAAWGRNLVDHWDECVAEVGEGTARVWGLYIAGSRVGFERDEVELHQVLATRNHDDGTSDFPMRPHW